MSTCQWGNFSQTKNGRDWWGNQHCSGCCCWLSANPKDQNFLFLHKIEVRKWPHTANARFGCSKPHFPKQYLAISTAWRSHKALANSVFQNCRWRHWALLLSYLQLQPCMTLHCCCCCLNQLASAHIQKPAHNVEEISQIYLGGEHTLWSMDKCSTSW